MCDLLQTEADALYLTKYNQDMYDPAFYGMLTCGQLRQLS